MLNSIAIMRARMMFHEDFISGIMWIDGVKPTVTPTIKKNCMECVCLSVCPSVYKIVSLFFFLEGDGEA